MPRADALRRTAAIRTCRLLSFTTFARATSTRTQVVQFYVEQRPAGVDASASLQASGVLRALCSLACGPCRWAWSPSSSSSDPSSAAALLSMGEPLRAALLLCAACSPASTKWTLAVPGFAQALAGMRAAGSSEGGGALAAHGAVWELLVAWAGGGAPGGKGGDVAGRARAPDQQQQQQQQQAWLLAALLRSVATGQAGSGERGEEEAGQAAQHQVGALHQALQLLLRAWRAADRRLEWPAAVGAAMREATAALKARRSAAGGGSGGGGGGAPRVSREASGGALVARGSLGLPGQPAEGSAAGAEAGFEEAEGEGEGRHELVAFAQLQRRQWEAGCLACLKDLLMASGGKAD